MTHNNLDNVECKKVNTHGTIVGIKLILKLFKTVGCNKIRK